MSFCNELLVHFVSSTCTSAKTEHLLEGQSGSVSTVSSGKILNQLAPEDRREATNPDPKQTEGRNLPFINGLKLEK